MKFIDSYDPDQPLFTQISVFGGGRNPAFVAIEELTDEPLETRQRFIDEYAQWLQDNSDKSEVIANPRSTALNNLGYIAGYYGSSAEAQVVLDKWSEADFTLTHPIWGMAIPGVESAYIVSEIDTVERILNE